MVDAASRRLVCVGLDTFCFVEDHSRGSQEDRLPFYRPNAE